MSAMPLKIHQFTNSPIRRFAVSLPFIFVLPSAYATVLGFDELPSPGANFFTSNYHGFQFGTSNSQNSAWYYTDEVSEFVKPQSGNKFIATNFQLYANDGSYQSTQAISSATPFIFNGAYFSDSPAFDMPDRISYQLYLGSALVFTSALSPPLTAAPQFVQSGFNDLITSVVITGQQGYYGLDNFTYNEFAITPIPEPKTSVLMLVSLIGVVAVVRSRNRHGKLSA